MALNRFMNLGKVTESSHHNKPTSPITIKVLTKDDRSRLSSPCNTEANKPANAAYEMPVKKDTDAECSQPVTCVLPIFVIAEPIISCGIGTTAAVVEPTAATGTIMATAASGLLPIPGVSHKTPQKYSQSSYVPVIAKSDGGTYTPVIISPFKPIDSTEDQAAVTPQQKMLETTPTKGSPDISHMSAVFPKQLSFSPTKVSRVTPTKSALKKLNESPRRQYLQAKSKQARNLLSKGFVLNSRISPVKIAAYSLRNRARRQMYSKTPVKILPKPPAPLIPLPIVMPSITNNTQIKELSKTAAFSQEAVDGYDTIESENISDIDLSKTSDLVKAESDDTQSETDDMGLSQYDSQNEEEVLDGQEKDEHLATLMAASSTIG